MRLISYKELPLERRFGVEFEVSAKIHKKEIGKAIGQFEEIYGGHRSVIVSPGLTGWASTDANDYWHVKYDSTCGILGKGYDSGWEIASYIGSGIQDIHHISRCARYLSNCGLETTINCGLHIHVETKDYCKESMGRLLARWIKVEQAILLICASCRRKNEYCQTLTSRVKRQGIQYDPNRPGKFWDDIRPQDLGHHNNPEKRYSLNTIGFANCQLSPKYTRNTIELRLPECVLSEHHVRNWIKFILHFVESCKDSISPLNLEPVVSLDDILLHVGLQGSEQEFFLVDQELLGLKAWFLRKMMASEHPALVPEAQKKLDFIGLI